MYEHHTQPLLSLRAFVYRMARHGGYGLGLISFSLCVGMAGYRWIAHFTWVDAFLNASMLLGGMGPIGELPSDGAKIFAGLYALYSGLVFLALAALILAPVFHRVMHRIHFGERSSP